MRFFELCAILSFVLTCFALDNGQAKTPAMGWSSWNHYACQINETVLHFYLLNREWEVAAQRSRQTECAPTF